MKKFITAAALLAAGTAFSNADVTILTEAPVSASGSDIVTLDLGGSQAWNSAWSLVFTVSADSFTEGSALTLLALDTKNRGTEKNNFSGIYGVTSTGSSVVFTHYDKTNESAVDISSANTDVTFVLSRDSSGNASLSIYADGDFGTALSTQTIGSTQSYGSTALSEMNFGGYDTSYTPGSNFTGNDLVGSFTLLGAGYSFGSVADTAALQSYYSTVIPEPSAFGLLAGVGALALVAARRRRTK